MVWFGAGVVWQGQAPRRSGLKELDIALSGPRYFTEYRNSMIFRKICRCDGKADMRDLKSLGGNSVPVQVRSAVFLSLW